MEKVNGGWRVTAIILGVILLAIIGITMYGFRIAGAEDSCIEYCYDGNYESFYYDYDLDKCDCYIGEDIIESIHILR